MKDMFFVLASVTLTIFCWGMYGPIMHKGQIAMEQSRFRQLICVGAAYFLIAVVVPFLWIHFRGDVGAWTGKGITWSLIAGSAGAFGALGIIFAFSYEGRPEYVMPLVFGFAPIVNAFITLYPGGKYKEMPPLALGGFIAGLLMVSVGAFLVLTLAMKYNKPKAAHAEATAKVEAEADTASAESEPEADAESTE